MTRPPSPRTRSNAWASCVGGLIAGLCSLAVAATAFRAVALDAPPVADALDRSIEQWWRQSGIKAASLAAIENGVIVKSAGYGGMDPAKPARIASLSKAITAVCIARLIDEGRLAFTSPLGKVLAGKFKTAGNPVDPRFKTITIEQLLLHRSGLPREARNLGPPAHDMNGTFAKILATPLEDPPDSDMEYSNIGYLTLGIVVEAVTGKPYEGVCRETALVPLGATGSIDPALAARAPNGGWRVSAIDYAKFVQVFDPKNTVLGATSRAWLDARRQTSSYSFGTSMRRNPNGIVYWHSGRVAAKERGGGYTIKFDNGWTTVVLFEGDLSGPGYSDLRKRLTAAVSGKLPATEVDGPGATR